MTDLQTGGQGVATALIRTGSSRSLVEQVLELGFDLLEPGRVDVRQVVRDDVEVRLLGLHPGRG